MSKILYVDDDPQMLEIFEVCFGERFDVMTCPDGASALEILAQGGVSVLFADHEMPGMTGLELVRQVRDRYPQVVRMLTTGGNLDGILGALGKGLVRGCIAKPWDQDLLSQCFDGALEAAQLQQRVYELESRLQQNERLYALGLVAAGIAHELRNPLTAMTGNADVRKSDLAELEKSLEAGDTRRALSHVRSLKTYIDEDVESIELMTAICRGVEQSGPSSDRREYCNLVEVVRTTLQGTQGSLRGHSRLEVQLDEATPIVRGSRSKLAQVFLNLFANAMQSRENEDEGVLVRVVVEPVEDRVVLIVQDDGVGIDPSLHDKIFQPFFTTKNEKGTGLGLAITRKIVEELHGSIAVDSRLGSGTRFVVSLPAAEQQQ